jgi:hypothetical protein
MTSSIRHVGGFEDPVVVVVEDRPGLSIAIAEVCDFLRIRVEFVADAHELALCLPDVQPIAVLSESAEITCKTYDLLMVVADYDPATPMMMVIKDEPANRGALDAAQKLWQLTEVTRLGQRPGIRALIDFLFLAGRKHGGGRMMPI